MRKVRVTLYFGRSFDKNGTAPLCISVNHASSSCYIPMQGVRLKPSQWDKVRKKVVNHPQADTINSVALSTLAKANEAIMHLGSVRGMTTAQVRDLIAEHIYPDEGIDDRMIKVMQSYMDACDRPNTADKYRQTITHIQRFLGAKRQRHSASPTLTMCGSLPLNAILCNTARASTPEASTCAISALSLTMLSRTT